MCFVFHLINSSYSSSLHGSAVTPRCLAAFPHRARSADMYVPHDVYVADLGGSQAAHSFGRSVRVSPRSTSICMSPTLGHITVDINTANHCCGSQYFIIIYVTLPRMDFLDFQKIPVISPYCKVS